MTYKQIIRNFKLHIISDIELEEPYPSIYNSLLSDFNYLKILKSTNTFTYYGTCKANCLLRIREVSNNIQEVMIHNDKIWMKYNKHFDLGYNSTKELLHWAINNIANIKLNDKVFLSANYPTGYNKTIFDI